jgi:hypothetical protein
LPGLLSHFLAAPLLPQPSFSCTIYEPLSALSSVIFGVFLLLLVVLPARETGLRGPLKETKHCTTMILFALLKV